MGLPRDVTITKDGGYFYRCVAFRSIFTLMVLPFVLVAVILAILNPFWFRDSFFSWIEDYTSRIVRWRNYQQYRIYLGTDPTMWHALKDGGERIKDEE